MKTAPLRRLVLHRHRGHPGWAVACALPALPVACAPKTDTRRTPVKLAGAKLVAPLAPLEHHTIMMITTPENLDGRSQNKS